MLQVNRYNVSIIVIIFTHLFICHVKRFAILSVFEALHIYFQSLLFDSLSWLFVWSWMPLLFNILFLQVFYKKVMGLRSIFDSNQEWSRFLWAMDKRVHYSVLTAMDWPETTNSYLLLLWLAVQMVAFMLGITI